VASYTADYDFVIIGAGSAGCVLANRLSADRSVKVALIEAGGSDLSPFVAAPVGETKLLGTSYDWCFQSEPEAALSGQRFDLARGKVLGGSSSINGQIYFRGFREDFDDLARDGNPGWDYASVLPLFRKAERWQGGASEARGGDGPIRTCHTGYHNEYFDAFIAAGVQAGYRKVEDYVSEDPVNAFAYCQFTQFRYPRLRCSASYGYLFPARFRRNLKIHTQTLARRILFEGRRAVGVEILQSGAVRTLRAGQVILCGGAYNSPKLLMLSGVGPADVLDAQRIDRVKILNAVGRNLQDEIGSIVQHDAPAGGTYFNLMRRGPQAMALAKWALLGRGPLSVFAMNAMAWLKSDPALDRPDLYFYMFPVAMNANNDDKWTPRSHGYNIHWALVRPKSAGRVTLRSSRPEDAPIIANNFFDNEHDRALNRRAVEIARNLHGQPAFDGLRGAETVPGAGVTSAEGLDGTFRRFCSPHYTPAGTCAIGGDEATSVVTHDFRVHGLEGLRVADNSIMPRDRAPAMNAVAIMIGEKAAADILRK
jgi:choline dehydrogenase